MTLLLVSGMAAGGDWTGWRGNQRDGRIEGFEVPGVWPDDLENAGRSRSAAATPRRPALHPRYLRRSVGLGRRHRRAGLETGGRTAENAAFLTAPGVVLMLTTDGELTVLDAGADRLERLASYRVAESETWAHPAVVGDGILIKDADTLTLWSLAPASPPEDGGGPPGQR